MDYEALFVGLAIDLVAIGLLAYAIYFRRHRRRDLTLGFIGVNIGLFAVASFIANGSLSVGFGIGLFALLSVIRLRSTQITQEEIGYYFIALVLGLVNGVVPEESWGRVVVLNAALIGVMFVADHPRVLPHAERRIVVLAKVHRREEALRRDIEERIGYEVVKLHVLDVDYVHHRTKVDVRFRTDRPVASTPKKPKKPKVTIGTEGTGTGTPEPSVPPPAALSLPDGPDPVTAPTDPSEPPEVSDPAPPSAPADGQ